MLCVGLQCCKITIVEWKTFTSGKFVRKALHVGENALYIAWRYNVLFMNGMIGTVGTSIPLANRPFV